MIIRRYDPKDFEQIQTWLDERDCQRFESHLMPKFGQVVEGVAAGFVIDTDSNFSVLDYFCTNPKASIVERIRATKEMLQGAIRYSEERGYKFAIGNTRNRGMIKFAQRIGWKVDPTPYYCFRKSLTEPKSFSSLAVPFEERHRDEVESWLCDRKDFFHGSGPLPRNGLIVPGLGCAFLISTSCGVAILDAFATNRDAPIHERIRAASDLTESISNYAYQLGFRAIIGSTKSIRGMSILCKHGFAYDPRPYHFLRKKLKGEKRDERGNQQFDESRAIDSTEGLWEECGEVV